MAAASPAEREERRLTPVDEYDRRLADLLRDELDRLVRFAYFIVGDRDLAEDVTAEAIERVLPHWRRGGIDEPMAYLRRAVVNVAANRHRRRCGSQYNVVVGWQTARRHGWQLWLRRGLCGSTHF